MIEPMIRFLRAPIFAGDPEKTQDALTTHRVAVALLFLAALSVPLILLLPSPAREIALGATSLGILFWLVTIQLVKRGQLTPAKLIILSLNTINIFGVLLVTGGIAQPTVFTLLFLLAMANLLFPQRGSSVYGTILILLVSAMYYIDQFKILPPVQPADLARSTFLNFAFTLIAVAAVMFIASSNYQRNLNASRKNEQILREQNRELDQLRSNLEQRVEERTTQIQNRANQIEAISAVARSIASVQNLETLLPTITRLVSVRFNYYHAGIFLVDDAYENAVLRATNSEGGQRMLDRQHSLRLDGNSIVGYAASRSETRIALDVGADSVYFNNPDLPDTRSEMALPLRVGQQVIGVLDVQSTQPNAFSTDDIATLEILADQVAIAIENARLFSEARNALAEAERSFERYVKQEWSSFAQTIKSAGYIFDGNRTTPLRTGNQQAKVKALAQTGRLSLEKETNHVSVPIKFRGHTVGFLDVKSKKGDRRWTRDELTMLESAAERAALALENARLVETAQRRAYRERTIGEISARIGAVSNLEAIMQTAVEELGRRIGSANEVTFELEPEDPAQQE